MVCIINPETNICKLKSVLIYPDVLAWEATSASAWALAHTQKCSWAWVQEPVQVIGTARIYSYTRVLLSFKISSVEQNIIRMYVVSYIL